MKLGLILKKLDLEYKLTSDEIELVTNVSSEYKDWVRKLSFEEKRLLKKYTYNSHDASKPNRFFERLNKALRGDYYGKDKEKLVAYGKIISNALKKHPLKNAIYCYRGVDDDLLSDVVVGSTFKFNQFISTSIVETGALKKRYKYIINVPSGVNGAYIGDVSKYKSQYEFLLDYDCEYRLISKSGRNVFLEVIV